MRKPSIYGGQPEIIAATQIYKRTIIVFQQAFGNYNYQVYKYQNNMDNLIFLFNCRLSKIAKETNHYESLRPNIPMNDLNPDGGRWDIGAANPRPGSAVAGLANLSQLGKLSDYCIYRNKQQYCYPPQFRETIDLGYQNNQPVKFDIEINGQNEHHEITFDNVDKVKKGQYTLYRVEK